MSTSRTVRAASRAATLLVVAGCYSYQRAGPGPLGSYADVRIRYTPPQDVVVSSTANAATVLPSVERLRGRVLSIAGDSLRLHVTTATDRTGQPLGLAADATTWVVRGPTTQVEVHRLSKGRTALFGGGVVGVAVLLAAAIVAAMAFSIVSGY
jgi:hypothetical protein